MAKSPAAVRNARRFCLQYNAERPSCSSTRNSGRPAQLPKHAMSVLIPGNDPIDRTDTQQSRKEAQVENVAAQSQQTAIREEKRLHGQYQRDDQKCGVWSESERSDQPPADMSARPVPGIEKLIICAAKIQCAKHAHHGDKILLQGLYSLSASTIQLPDTAHSIHHSRTCRVVLHVHRFIVASTGTRLCSTPAIKTQRMLNLRFSVNSSALTS